MDATDSKCATASSFAYEWARFNRPPSEWEENFRGYFQFFSPDFFKGKSVLDAGSGMGRHTYHLAQLARSVVAIDLGAAIRVTAQNVSACQNVRLIQTDIDYLPFRPESFDFICSIGVLHHLRDPRAGFRSLIQALRPGGTIHIYVYWALEDAPAWKRLLLRSITALRRLTTKLPYRLLENVAFMTAVVGFVCFSLPYRVFSRFRLTRPLVRNFPLRRYAMDGFRVCFNDQFDRLSAPIEHRFTRKDVVRLFEQGGLVDVWVAPHHGWLACGTRPSKVLDKA